MYLIKRNVSFGDVMMAGLAVATLNDYGVTAALETSEYKYKKVISVPQFNESQKPNWEKHFFKYEHFRKDQVNYVQEWLDRFSSICGVKAKITRKEVPVFFSTILGMQKYDVAINSQTGDWSPYRVWPHFEKLKTMLDKANLTWLDLDDKKVYNNECLNVIKNSKLYLGLDTGRSHYVSSQAKGKTLIIQSGNNNKIQWCNYDYDFIEQKVGCSPCYLREGCQYSHDCMTKIQPEYVFERIIDKLSKNKKLLL